MSEFNTDSDSTVISISAASAVQDTADHGASTRTGNGTIDTKTRSTADSSAPPAAAIASSSTPPPSAPSAVAIASSTPLPSALSISSATADTTNTNTTATTASETAERGDDSNKATLAAATLPSKPPAILLPPVEIEPTASNKKNDKDDSNKENVDPVKPVPKLRTPTASASKITKPATSTGAATKKPLSTSASASTAKAAAGSTTPAKTSSCGRLKEAATPIPRTFLISASKQRPVTPVSVKSGSSSSVPTTSSSSASTTRPALATSRTASATAVSRSLAVPPTTIRRSPSTPSLPSASTGTTRTISSAGRRVASSSSVSTGSSPRTSPAVTPSITRTFSQTSLASTVSSSPARRPPLRSTASSPSSALPLASRPTATRTNTSTSTSSVTSSPLGVSRRTPSSSTNPSPNSSLRQPSTRTTTTTRLTAAQAVTPTSSIRKTPTSTTAAGASTRTTTSGGVTRPITDAVKVKMLSTQLNGLQEKHDNTLKLLQEQEERMRRELEELTFTPEPQRKPISSDVQQVLQEMEDLRKQFSDAQIHHAKALEDIAAERALEISMLRETHEALLSAMTAERDAVAESLKALQESGELSEREKDAKVKELEAQMEASLQSQAEAVAVHAEALEALRADIESAWTMKHDAEVQELIRVHEEQITALTESGNSKDSEIQELKDSFAQQIKDLEEVQESRMLELVTKHETEVQEWENKLTSDKEAHEELIGQLKQEHLGTMEKITAELQAVQASQVEAEQELERVNVETKGELESMRAEVEEIRKLLAAKESEVEELNKRVDELMEDLENASMSAMLKNTKKYKVKTVQIYGSSVSGNLKVKRAQQSISDTLEQLEIEYEFVDVSVSDEAKRHMRRKNGGETQLPQIFVGTEYRGVFDDFEYAIETHQLPQFLGFDRVRGFVPRHKDEFMNGAQAQDGEDAEQGAGSPNAVMNGVGSRSSLSAANSKTNGKNVGETMYLLSPASNKFQKSPSSPSSPSSISNGLSRNSTTTGAKAGFVQNASQVWDGALKTDITHAKHDLGFGQRAVIMDDDELDELFEQGAVTEADLEAMLLSA
ncbi:hypothetical protein BC939DRAFT_58311 [Gamsiella multidivaricata]|uniref:uncharacterized protein n=1 Tax=Gamsiella multidivaricata TaxID=101098 RepID=UPI00221EC3F5|nr:uncharacterized protein BC939DRAFT_58311 [Gamsiella multidivaricata]KAI7816139.1 hypothetical protein BC939DRAFT_58311 [Gamsiella multidivaricata]